MTAADHAEMKALRQRCFAAESAATALVERVAAAERDVAQLRADNDVFAGHVDRALKLTEKLSYRVELLEGGYAAVAGDVRRLRGGHVSAPADLAARERALDRELLPVRGAA
ncbi:MAG: hypothetical protein JWO85_2163 [Candidatus Eremiobacteraeota bacterium]|nr:hypothetical protein [Candidatus Eremiobacteraeota bacterium]